MKNLLVYVNPKKEFDTENKVLIKVQIDNSLELGWDLKDIILVTDFDYEYRGVKATLVKDGLFYPMDKASSKIGVISYLLNHDMLEDSLYWYHDIDAFENNKIEESELGMDGLDLGLTNYCYKEDWNGGSFFFRLSAKDIFSLWTERILARKRRGRADEQEMKKMTALGIVNSSRYKLMNSTYNVQYRDAHFSYIKSSKPLKVIHVHPMWTLKEDPRLPDTILNTFMYGKNLMGIPLMSVRLIKILQSYGIK